MSQPGFIFGAPGLPATPQELSDKRKAAQAMIARALGRAPKNVGEGLNAIGQALIARSMEDEARKSQQAGLASGQAATTALMGGMTAPDTVSGGTGGAATAPAPSPASPASPASFSGGSQEFVAQMMPHAQRVAQQTGVDPRIVIAQAALESGWGRRAPGNNFFGIKSHGVPGGNTFATTEVVNGQPIRTRDSFRAYGSMGESADGYAQFLRQNPRYRPMLQAQGLDAQIQALGASGYATDPNYAAKIRQIASGIQVPQAAPVAAPVAQPPDSLDGGDGSDPAPLIDGRNLPDSGALPAPDLAGTFDTMRMAAPGPMDPRARSFDQIAQAGMQPSQAMAPAPSVDSMMAGQQITPPMQAQPAPPVPAAPMPAAPAVAAPMQAPMPMARPNIEPPPQAQPAMAQQPVAPPMGGMNERDRLMLLRDEQSLAPGEAQTLRAGLGGGNPVEMIAQALGRPQTPSTVPQAPTQPAPAQPAPVASVAAAMGAPASQAAPAQAGSPQSRVAAALQVLNNPWAPPGTQAMAQSILQQSLTPRAPISVKEGETLLDPVTRRPIYTAPERSTDDIRNYNAYSRQEREAGRVPLSQFEWGQQRRRAGSSSVNVNTTETGDAAFNTETAKKQAAMFDTLATDGLTARADAARIGELRRLGERIGTGAGANLQAFAAQYGIKLGENIGEVEAFQAIVSQLVPNQRPAGSGAMSDRDVGLFRNSLPSLIKTPGGNALIFDTMQSIAEYRQQQAQIATRAQMGEIPRAQAIRELQALPDPLEAFRKSRANPPSARGGGTQPPAPAVEMLRGNPTPTARQQFDQVFGAGAAERVLGGR